VGMIVMFYTSPYLLITGKNIYKWILYIYSGCNGISICTMESECSQSKAMVRQFKPIIPNFSYSKECLLTTDSWKILLNFL
jgi:hypothetical protein